MAVEIERKRGRQLTYEGGDGTINVNWPLVYDVRDSTATLTESQILESAGLPKINQIVQVDGSRIPVACKRKEAVEDVAKKGYWTVTCHCDNLPGKASQALGTGESEDDPTDPTQWTVIVDPSFETTEVLIETDVFGNAIENFAGRPYADAKTRRALVTVLPFTQYEPASLTLDQITERNDTISDGIYLGKAKGAWHLSIEDSDLVYKNGLLCWRIDYKLRCFEKAVTAMLSANALWTKDESGSFVSVNSTDLAYGRNGKQYVGGWNPIYPQSDYIDVNGAPVVDAKDNQILGKLDTGGVRVAGASQGSATQYWVLHQAIPYTNLSSFLRIQGA